MKILHMAALGAAGLALAGCKTEFAAEVPLSALQDPAVTELPATVRLEVMTCQDYEDSREPSDALVKAQEMMPRVFPSAEFSDCYTQSMDSWAEFDLVLPIDRSDDPESFASDDAFNITTSELLPLGVAVPPAVIQRLEEAQRADMMMPDLEYRISLRVVNDSGETFTPTVLAAWANEYPLTLHEIEIQDGDAFTLTLSDVLIDRAMQNGEASVLVDMEGLLEQREG